MRTALRTLGPLLLVGLAALASMGQLNRVSWTQIVGNPIAPIALPFSAAGAPTLTFAGELTKGMYSPSASGELDFSVGGTKAFAMDATSVYAVRPTLFVGAAPVSIATSITAGTANIATAPTDSTAVEAGGLTRFRSSSTITPATAGVGNCGAAFLAALTTADCTIATLPAGMKLVAIYADVTVGFACSGTCTGTKVMQAGTAVNGTQVLAASLNVAAPATYGLADADLGSGLVRAAAIQGGLIGSWTATTPISVRFTSGTGAWGSGAATFVNAGSVKFTLITEQIK